MTLKFKKFKKCRQIFISLKISILFDLLNSRQQRLTKLKRNGKLNSARALLYVTLFNRTYLCCLDLLRAATSTVQMSHRCKQFAFLLCFYFTLISRRHVLPKYGASSSFRPTAHVQARSELKTRETFATRLAMKFSTNP